MKNIILFSLIILFISGCSTKKQESNNIKYFTNNVWMQGDKIILKGDSIYSYKYYDSINKIMVGDTLFPLIISDSTIIYKKIEGIRKINNDNDLVLIKDTVVIDTIKYDFCYINNKPKLILYFKSYPIVCYTKNDNLKITVTNNYKPIKFIMGGYTIGDDIDRDLLKTRGVYNYETYTIEDCELIDNRNISIKIIGYNIIYSLERKNIPDFRVNDIIKVINKKLNQQAVYSPMQKWSDDDDYEYEFYRWSKDGIRMTLTKSNYVGETSYKNLFNNTEWTLSYDDDVQKVILIEKYKNSSPQSTIIK
ncbi:MAG: hypothetical protein KAT68_14290 [Bacteroidales bacterium]|nr:hypothetical protein [Bacteroidales bacterium]